MRCLNSWADTSNEIWTYNWSPLSYRCFLVPETLQNLTFSSWFENSLLLKFPNGWLFEKIDQTTASKAKAAGQEAGDLDRRNFRKIARAECIVAEVEKLHVKIGKLALVLNVNETVSFEVSQTEIGRLAGR